MYIYTDEVRSLYKYPSHPIYKCLVISHYNWPSTGARWLLQSHEFFSVPSHGGVPQNAGPQNHWSPPGKGTEKSIGQYKRIHKNAGMSTHVHHEIHPYASRPCFDHGAYQMTKLHTEYTSVLHTCIGHRPLTNRDAPRSTSENLFHLRSNSLPGTILRDGHRKVIPPLIGINIKVNSNFPLYDRLP